MLSASGRTGATAGAVASVLIAADKFKGSLTAVQVADHLTAGLRSAAPGVRVESVPVADGGDGTVDAAAEAGFERRTVRVTGPLGDPVAASYALCGTTAVVEMAEASGLRQLPAGVFAPLTATTYGTGELLRAALDAGARTIVFGVGGSATTDGGAGMLAALGARLLDARGRPIGPGGGALRDLAEADLSGLDKRLTHTAITLASDVDNPLTGPTGAPAVYGPQKGASAADVAALDAALAHYADVLERAVGPSAAAYAQAPGAGAAGGIGYGALVGLGAHFRPGIEVMLDVLGFAPALARADLVITGEGSLDEQTLHGKAPAGVAAAARAHGVEVVAVCGRLALAPGALGRAGIRHAYALTALEPDPARCMAEAGPLLERVAAQIAADFLT
ncbi:glycerate kinase [Streptomyces zagrosensis]|uniref:Glycerate kinase n=1 Tax=Streptomyces zagrosensis TaxID=1042984 RepID=A0A7W9UZD5_9ACTN|nr:glycerate kinase [Streptomyces zagrosensis]MBB5936271.1 glycerate kinase [Streptomyces zagrosensis]